jgi:hypothetical protein
MLAFLAKEFISLFFLAVFDFLNIFLFLYYLPLFSFDFPSDTTSEAEYAHKVYSSGALLLNWVAVFSPFPVIAQDEENLIEKGNFQNYDAHFAPVYPSQPGSASYYACPHDQPHKYTELVVFDSSQILPHYIVELQPNLNLHSLSPPTSLAASPTATSTATPIQTKSVEEWTVADVCSWCSSLSLSKEYAPLFF